MNDKFTIPGSLQLALAMAISGTIGLFVVESGQGPINSVFFRCLFGALVLFLYIYIKGIFCKSYFRLKNTICMIVIGLSIVINWIALFSSYSYISIGLSTTIYHMQPFLVFFGGALFLNEKLGGVKLFYIVLGFLGLLLIVNPTVKGVGEHYFLGCFLALCAAFFYTVATLTAKKMDKIPPHIVAVVQMLIGVVVLLPLVDFKDLPENNIQWSLILTLGVIHSAIMYLMIYSAYQKLPTYKIAVLGYIYPLTALIVDYLYFGEALNALQIFGGALIVVSGMLGVMNFNPFHQRLSFNKL